MPKVELAHDVYAALQRRAVPFEEDINDVIRRLLRGDRSTFRDNADRPGVPAPAVHALTVVDAPAAPDRAPAGVVRADDGKVSVSRRTAPGERLAQSAVRAAVFGIVKSAAESITVAELFRSVERQLHGRMSAGDLEPSASGLPRWQYQVRNALIQLQHEGHVEHLGDDRYRVRTERATVDRRLSGGRA